MKVSVVIPNYNGANLLKKNLPSILESSNVDEVIIIDDASTDDSVVEINNQISNQNVELKLIQNPKNLGFSSTVNIGVNKASGDLVVLLNSDIYPKKEFLNYSLSHFKDEKVFAVGFLQQCHEQGKIISRGRGIGKFKRGFLIHERGEVDKSDTLWVSGGAGIFRKSIWRNLGGLTEIYNPFYWEDIDLSYRALKAGYKIVFEQKCTVAHHQVEGSIRSEYQSYKIKAIAFRNQFYFVWLNISDRDYLINHFLFLPYHFLKALINFNLPFFAGFLLALLKIPQVLSVRVKNSGFWKLTDKEILSSLKRN